MSRTRVIATVGPASRDPDTLAALIDAGVNIFRVNCSHGNADENAQLLRDIRRAVDLSGRLVGTIADLQGPKIRVGELDDGFDLFAGHEVVFRAGVREAEPGMVPVDYEGFADDLSPGDAILLDDGTLEVEVVSIDGRDVCVRVCHGGHLRSRKGINLPGTGLKTRAPTDKDLKDLARVLEAGVDYVALSFVRSPNDVVRLRSAIAKLGYSAPIISKFERPEAIEQMDSIVAESDAVMVARGDLGIETSQAMVPVLQKRLIATANRYSKPVIVATEMLESMVEHPRPTRAEVSDVANAVLDGADALMLSGETAMGLFPVSAAKRMGHIAEITESVEYAERYSPRHITGRDRARALAKAATDIVEDLDAVAIVVYTQTGGACRLVSSYRPRVPILALSPSEETLRRLMLIHGVQAAHAPLMDDADDLLREANDLSLVCGVAEPGDLIIAIFGIPGETGGTNRVIVHEVIPADVPADHGVHVTHRKLDDVPDPYAEEFLAETDI